MVKIDRVEETMVKIIGEHPERRGKEVWVYSEDDEEHIERTIKNLKDNGYTGYEKRTVKVVSEHNRFY